MKIAKTKCGVFNATVGYFRRSRGGRSKRPEHWLFTIPLRLRSLFHRAQADQELDNALRDHLEQRTNEYVEQGMTQKEAHRLARIDLGGVEKVKEECRDARGVRFLEALFQDIRFGARMLRKSPGFTAVAVLTLALGVAANTTIFRVVNAFLLRKPPVRDPDRVMVVSSISPDRNAYAPDRIPVSALDYLDWQAQSRSFDGMAAADFEDFTLSGGFAPQRSCLHEHSAFFRASCRLAVLKTFLPMSSCLFSVG